MEEAIPNQSPAQQVNDLSNKIMSLAFEENPSFEILMNTMANVSCNFLLEWMLAGKSMLDDNDVQHALETFTGTCKHLIDSKASRIRQQMILTGEA